MKEDLFINLPREIMIDILSGLPIPTIMSCKCVCKSWRALIESREFALSHLPKSVPLLVVQERYVQKPCKVLEFMDDQVNPFCNKSFTFNCPDSLVIESSVDGLLLLRERGNQRSLHICNPITREYIKLPRLPKNPHYFTVFGFGVSKLSRQYKIFCVINNENAQCKLDEGYIYTLGTGCWRSIIPSGDDRLLYFHIWAGVFLNGNLHRLVYDDSNGGTPWIQCLDLETKELSSTFSIPSPEYYDAYEFEHSLTALGGRLCFLGGYFVDGQIDIWLMKQYGDENSWTRKFVISEKCRWDPYINVYNIVYNNVYNNDYSLFWAKGYGEVVCFSTKTNTIRSINVPGLTRTDSFTTVTYTLRFLPQLKAMVKEKVISSL